MIRNIRKNYFCSRVRPIKKALKISKNNHNKNQERAICNTLITDPNRYNCFPTRNFRISKLIKKPIPRTRSNIADKFSLFEIENIERLQKLLPVRRSSSSIHIYDLQYPNDRLTTGGFSILSPRKLTFKI